MLLGSQLLLGCQQAPPVIVAGVLDPSSLDGARLAWEELASQHGAHTDTILMAEGSNHSGPALEAATRMVGTPGVVAVVGHSNSSASLASSQIYNRGRVVQLSPNATTDAYSEAGPFSFRMVPPDRVQGEVLARTVMDSLASGTRVALINVNDDYGRGLRSQFLVHLDADRFPVILDLPHVESAIQDVDRSHLLSALEAARPDALVWLSRWQLLDDLLPRIREAHGAIPIFGGDALAPADVRVEVSTGWEGVYYTDFVDLDATPELRAFQERFRARFHRTPGANEVLAYDAMGVVLAALSTGARTGEEVRSFLSDLGRSRPPYHGVAGPVSFRDNGDGSRGVGLKVMRPRVVR